jgi:hypothetical protein
LRIPIGLPNAKTVSPCRTCEYVASGSAGSFWPSIFNSARSSSAATPTIRALTRYDLPDSAVASVPSALSAGRTTWTLVASFTTWAFVMM